MIGLDKLEVGQMARVVKTEEKRLSDLGLVSGTQVECVLKSPLGDPKAYRIRGAVMAVRKAEARNIMVEVSNL
ncbi:MAG: ferrous iron transport protein A [Firmicutes bacterium]|nr:ferrous iron transport protein A [Bacillota bacterium]